VGGARGGQGSKRELTVSPSMPRRTGPRPAGRRGGKEKTETDPQWVLAPSSEGGEKGRMFLPRPSAAEKGKITLVVGEEGPEWKASVYRLPEGERKKEKKKKAVTGAWLSLQERERHRASVRTLHNITLRKGGERAKGLKNSTDLSAREGGGESKWRPFTEGKEGERSMKNKDGQTRCVSLTFSEREGLRGEAFSRGNSPSSKTKEMEVAENDPKGEREGEYNPYLPEGPGACQPRKKDLEPDK